MPADIPVTDPVPSTVAIAGLPLLHVPPEVVSPSVVELPTHTVVKPVIGATYAKQASEVISSSRVVISNFMNLIFKL